MKIKPIILISIFLSILFCGCSKDVKHIPYKLEKVGTITVDAVDEIVTKSFINEYGREEPDWMIKYGINYPNEHSAGDIDNPYRIGFHFKQVGELIRTNYNYDLCKDGKKYHVENLDDYRGYGTLVDDQEVLHMYLAIETMKKRGFIDNSLNSLGDICIYINDKYNLMNRIEKYESNTLIYTTEEINNALAEYKALQ